MELEYYVFMLEAMGGGETFLRVRGPKVNFYATVGNVICFALQTIKLHLPLHTIIKK